MAAVESLPDLVTIVKADGGLTSYTYYLHTLPKRPIHPKRLRVIPRLHNQY